MVEIRRILVFMGWIAFIECQMEPFVVGGTPANITHFPHSVFVHIGCYNSFYDQKNDWICGGSIVNELIVLTAAHCIHECSNRSVFVVYTGHAHRRKGLKTSVRTYFMHPKYDMRTLSNDITLLQLKSLLKFGDNVKRLAFMKNPPYHEKAKIAGWGKIYENVNKMSTYLIYVNQKVWRNSECERKLKSLPKGTICATSGNSTSYASKGDSGSALVVRGYIQIGIVSFKLPGLSKSLVVYTDTGYFYDWIRKNSKKLYCVTEKPNTR